ncbi:hypothetical protein SERLA73DRAFT_43542, partial [Serpula lacrymans var. lacrymans S7.3]
SWWPKNFTFMGSSLDTGIWTSSAEKWFHTCLEHIFCNTTELRGAKQWKNSLFSSQFQAAQ